MFNKVAPGDQEMQYMSQYLVAQNDKPKTPEKAKPAHQR